MDSVFGKFAAMHEQWWRCSGDQLRDFIFARQDEKLDRGAAMRAAISSVEELEEYNRRARKGFIDGLGGIPDMTGPLDARVTKRWSMDGFDVEHVVFRSTGRFYVTGSMFIPRGVSFPAPAILFACGHKAEGRMDDEYWDICRQFVLNGFVVFTIDPIGQGERASFYDPATGEYLIPRTTPDHDGCGVPGTAVGAYLERYFLCDHMRAIDYMLTRPEIDPARIGMTGNSGGGLQTISMMMCDDRIAAAAPATFLTTRREIMHTEIAQDAEQIWPGCDGYGMDHVNTVMMFAPKPVALLAVRYDFFPIEGTRELFEEAKRYYALYGKTDNLRMYEAEIWHAYSPDMVRYAIEFFTEVFCGRKQEARMDDALSQDADMRRATRTGNVHMDMPDSLTALDIAREIAAQQRAARLALPAAERRARALDWLRGRVMRERLPVQFNPRIFNAQLVVRDGGYVATRISWRTQRRLFSDGLLIRSEALEHAKGVPTVIAVWDDGTRALAAHEDWLRAQCAAGRQVLVLDLPGVGNNEQNHFGGKGYREHYGMLYFLCCHLLMMGDSMPAMQSYNVLRAIEFAQEFLGVSPQDMTLYCDGREGAYGVIAGALKAVSREYGDSLLRSVERELVCQRLPDFHSGMSYTVPGMLEYFDYGELMD